MARPHHRYRRPSRRPPPLRPRRLRGHRRRRSAALRRNTGVPLTRMGHPHPCTVEVDGAALRVAERRKHGTYPELARGGPQKLLVLAPRSAAQGFVRDLVRLRALRAPPAVRAAASSGWARRWWGALSVAVSSPLRARPWAVLRYLGRATAMHWIGCSTSPPTQGPAACPAALTRDREPSSE